MQTFTEVIPDFYNYLREEGKSSKKAIGNYISWLKFLNREYVLDDSISLEYITEILDFERTKKDSRTFYKTDKDISNFSSSLKKFYAFVASDYRRKRDDEIKSEENQILRSEIKETEKAALVQSRIGQGDFRQHLILYWHGCSITQFNRYDLLIASHIKPWKNSNNNERLDVFNGLLLLPNYDKLFDRGYISFQNNGKILLSPILTSDERKKLQIDNSLHLVKIDSKHFEYLEYHRNHCFLV